MKKFSIVTSCLNAEKYIYETIESVFLQTAFLRSQCTIEYIIVDGGSIDSTNEIINNFKKKFPQIIHISEKDNGLYDGLAKGFKLVTGDIVCYLNAGDFFNKSAFSVLNKVFDNDKINWVTGIKVIYNEESEIIDLQVPYKYRSNLIRCGVYGKNLPFIQQESTFWRKNLLDNLDYDFFKKLKLSGDMFLWCEFAKKNSLYIVFSYLSGFKYHSNQLSFKFNISKDIYLDEMKLFVKKKNLIHYIQIIIDSPFWFISRNLSRVFNKFSKNFYSLSIKNQTWITKKKNYQDQLFCWACDYRLTNGEGILGKIFIDKYISQNYFDKNCISLVNIKNKVKLIDFEKNNYIFDSSYKLSFVDKYIAPFCGIIFLWLKYFQGKKIMYINFLPLWNFLLFLLLPPNTILGPITGSRYYNESEVNGFDKFFRKFLMNYFFKISDFILQYRFDKLIFASENLKKILSKKIIKKSQFNFIFNSKIQNMNVKNLKSFKEREFDFIFYIRAHPTKGNEILIKFIQNLKKNYKVITIGEKIGIDGIKEFGFVSQERVLDLCLNCKCAILSSENFFSLFSADCILSNTFIFFNELNEYDKKLELENKIMPINYLEIDKNLKLIKNKFETF